MRVYISGPMTGKPELNRPAFDAAEEQLLGLGHFVINPHRISELIGSAAELSASFREYYRLQSLYKENEIDDSPICLMAKYRTRVARAVMDADLAAVRSCDAILLLNGWEKSRGAKKELDMALAHGLQVYLEVDAANVPRLCAVHPLRHARGHHLPGVDFNHEIHEIHERKNQNE